MTENIFPYELPKNWQWVKIESVIKLISGRDVPLSRCNEQKKGIPYVMGASNFSGDKFFAERWIEIPEVTSEKNDILISVKGTIGKVYFQNEEKLNISRQIMAIRPIQKMHSKYFFWFFIFMSDELKLSGNGMIPGIPRSKILEIPIPVPPLDEQKRIVEVIESLFEKLDAAKGIVQKIFDGYELRRAAILHKAFTGELTKNFRAKNNLNLDDWQQKNLGEVLLPTENTKPTGKNFRYIDIDSIDNKRQRVKAPKIIETEKAPSRAIRQIKENDVLFSMVRPYLKNIALIDESLEDCISSSGFFVCRCNEKIFSRFLYNFLRSEDAISYLMQFMKGDNSPSIRKEEFLSLSVNLPPIDEQKEIVRILDSLIEKETRTKDFAEKILSEIDLLKKTILARAFRGKLGTNAP